MVKKNISSYSEYAWNKEEWKALDLSDEQITIIFQSLLRTGLVILEQNVRVEDETDYKTLLGNSNKYVTNFDSYYSLTPLMNEICKFLTFDGALKKEKIYPSEGDTYE